MYEHCWDCSVLERGGTCEGCQYEEKPVKKVKVKKKKIETTGDIMNVPLKVLQDYAFEVTAERNALKAEIAELKARLKESRGENEN